MKIDRETYNDSTQAWGPEKGESISMQKSGFKGYTYANCSQGNLSWDFENLDYQTNKHKYC